MAGDRLPTKAIDFFKLPKIGVSDGGECEELCGMWRRVSYGYISKFTIISDRESCSLWAGLFGVQALVWGVRFFSFLPSSRQVLGSIQPREQWALCLCTAYKALGAWRWPSLLHLAYRLKKEYGCTSTPSLRLRGMLRGHPFFVSRRNLLPLFCLGEGDDRFWRNVGTFLSAYVQSPLRRQQLRRSFSMHYIVMWPGTPLSHSVNFIPTFCGRTVDRGSARRKVFVPEDENKNVETSKNYKHISNALDWIRTHGANIRE
jgi:hypothetical protein